jgi:hypothetical protein
MDAEKPDKHEKEEKDSFDLFELCTAILLGFAAVGAALSGLQGDQWGGKQLEAFSEANALTTKAATQYNEDIVWVNADYGAVAQAKDHILQARDAKDPQDRERHLEMASYIYTTQLTSKAYHAMHLPAEYYVEDEDEAAKDGNAPAAKPTAAPTPAEAEDPNESGDEASEAEDPNHPTLERDIPDDVLLASLKAELDEPYIDASLADGNKMFEQADQRFGQGRAANDIGDKFGLAGVFYAVALFFGGLGLVFKSRVRWIFFVMGTLVFLGASLFIARLPWVT